MWLFLLSWCIINVPQNIWFAELRRPGNTKYQIPIPIPKTLMLPAKKVLVVVAASDALFLLKTAAYLLLLRRDLTRIWHPYKLLWLLQSLLSLRDVTFLPVFIFSAAMFSRLILSSYVSRPVRRFAWADSAQSQTHHLPASPCLLHRLLHRLQGAILATPCFWPGVLRVWGNSVCEELTHRVFQVLIALRSCKHNPFHGCTQAAGNARDRFASPCLLGLPGPTDSHLVICHAFWC